MEKRGKIPKKIYTKIDQKYKQKKTRQKMHKSSNALW